MFDPKLTPAEGMHRYTDGRISGVLEIGDGWAVIYEWSSTFTGHGHSVDALTWLRANGASIITAFNMGMPPADGEPMSPHTAYWLRMKDRGLVQELIDDDGNDFSIPVDYVRVERKHSQARNQRPDPDVSQGLDF